jgi:NADH-quinone oxidoreductase subunit L
VVAVSGWMKKFDTKVIDGFVNFLPGLIRRLAAFISWFDRVVIDGVVNGLARLAGLAGDMIRLVQTGSIQGYIGLAVFGLIILYVMTWII